MKRNMVCTTLHRVAQATIIVCLFSPAMADTLLVSTYPKVINSLVCIGSSGCGITRFVNTG